LPSFPGPEAGARDNIHGVHRGQLLENLSSLYRISLLYCLSTSVALIELRQGNLYINIPQENLNNIIAGINNICSI